MKTDFSLSNINAVASIKSRHGQFACDFSEKDSKKKLTLLFVSEKTKKLVPFAEIPVMPRQEVIKILNILGSYAKACEKFESPKLNTSKLLVSHSDFVDLLTGRSGSGSSKKSEKTVPADGKRRSMWGD